MRASEGLKLRDKLFTVICDYAWLAYKWEVREEDDVEDFKDELLDIITGTDNEEIKNG